CVVGKHVAAAAVAEFNASNDNIERCESFFPLEPAHPAFAGQIERIRVLQHQALVPALRSRLEKRLEFNAFIQEKKWSNMQRRPPFDGVDCFFPLDKGFIENIPAVISEDVKDHERDGDIGNQSGRGTLSSQPLLEQSKWQDLVVLE